MSPWVRSLSDLKPFQDLEEFQIKWKEKQSSDSWDRSLHTEEWVWGYVLSLKKISEPIAVKIVYKHERNFE